MSKIRTRFAPSPTGLLHLGSLRTALYAYLFAKKNNGAFILRIEDTDQARLVEGAVDSLIEILKWVGIFFDEGPHCGGDFGPYIQSERLTIYKKYLQILIDMEKAYYCFCSKEKLESLRETQQEQKLPPKYDGHCRQLTKNEIESRLKAMESYVIRLAIPKDRTIKFNDLIRGTISIGSNEIDDQVLMKSDGFPTYHLANVVDDHLMEITHVIRAEEWISSTPKHIILYEAFGWDAPSFAHLPLILNQNKSKLSKRHNDVATELYKQNGYLPECMINFVAFLGWNPGTDKEIFSMDDLISAFEIEKVHKSGAIFDRVKLDWMNGLYIRNLSEEELYAKSLPYIQGAGIVCEDIEYMKSVLKLEQTRIKTFGELPDLIRYFFEENLSYDYNMLKWKKGDLEEAFNRLNIIYSFIKDMISDDMIKDRVILEKIIKSYIEEKLLGVGNTLWPLRVSLSGKENSPSPFELISVLGKERTLNRIEYAKTKLVGIKKL